MKKLLLAFAILGFVACGGNETETTTAPDTTSAVTPTEDTTNVGGDTTNVGGGDTSAAAKGGDTTATKNPQ